MALVRKEIEVRPGVTTTIKVAKGSDGSEYVMERAGGDAEPDAKSRTAAKNKARSTEEE